MPGESSGGRGDKGTLAKLTELGEAGKLASGYVGELEVCGNSPLTVYHYSRSLSFFLSHLAEQGVDFRQVQYQHMITFLQKLRLAGMAESTLKARLSAVSSWYRWLKRVKVVSENPCELVPPIRVPEHNPEFFTQEEAARLLKAARTYPLNMERNVALLEFLYASGARRSETAALNVDDIFDGEIPFCRIRMGKGRKDRDVLLTPQFMKAWRTYSKVRTRILAKWERPLEKAAFVSREGRRLGGKGVYLTVTALCRHAGVRELYPHAVRHTAATHMLDGGDDLMDIKEQLGHKSLATTQIYLHVSMKRRWEKYRQAHPGAQEADPGPP